MTSVPTLSINSPRMNGLAHQAVRSRGWSPVLAIWALVRLISLWPGLRSTTIIFGTLQQHSRTCTCQGLDTSSCKPPWLSTPRQNRMVGTIRCHWQSRPGTRYLNPDALCSTRCQWTRKWSKRLLLVSSLDHIVWSLSMVVWRNKYGGAY